MLKRIPRTICMGVHNAPVEISTFDGRPSEEFDRIPDQHWIVTVKPCLGDIDTGLVLAGGGGGGRAGSREKGKRESDAIINMFINEGSDYIASTLKNGRCDMQNRRHAKAGRSEDKPYCRIVKFAGNQFSKYKSWKGAAYARSEHRTGKEEGNDDGITSIALNNAIMDATIAITAMFKHHHRNLSAGARDPEFQKNVNVGPGERIDIDEGTVHVTFRPTGSRIPPDSAPGHSGGRSQIITAGRDANLEKVWKSEVD
ncbi:hypothetical protein DMN91_009028 [Ooceraea biroi]|uniref:Uncharacterized protein n=1 Tax=Ooceraea biroi TaxID=2015173 RepID=A0A3L8DEB6_OOCBI|nr:hypothetical protein DMN91_009028 [Ooceraea biroi]